MTSYIHKDGKKRVVEILDNKLNVINQDKLPKDEEFTYTNAYYGWVSAIFIDIRGSSKIFENGDQELVSKVIRCFTSEIIEILRDDDNIREIGIRGDCVYSVYTTPDKQDILEIAEKAFYINTLMKMLNLIFKQRGLPFISVGIGLSSDKELVVKAGRKGTGINNQVWIGKAVSKSSNLSSIGNKNGNSPIVVSSVFYDNFIELFEEINKDKNVRSWFTKVFHKDYGIFYHANIVKTDFNDWIEEGMNE